MQYAPWRSERQKSALLSATSSTFSSVIICVVKGRRRAWRGGDGEGEPGPGQGRGGGAAAGRRCVPRSGGVAGGPAGRGGTSERESERYQRESVSEPES